MKRARLRKKDINGSDKYPDARTVGRKFEPFLDYMKVTFDIPEKEIKKNAYLLMAQGDDDAPANFVERVLEIESVEVSSDVYADEKEFVQGISLLALAQIAKQMEV